MIIFLFNEIWRVAKIVNKNGVIINMDKNSNFYNLKLSFNSKKPFY